MKGVITIFTLPQEIEDLALTLYNLKKNSLHIKGDVEYRVEINICLSSELTDWKKTSLPREYIRERALELCTKYLDWCSWELVWDEPSILGCVSQRRHSWRSNQDADFFIWLDNDLFFPDNTLCSLEIGYKKALNLNYEHFIITPEYIQQWDSTWEAIVNKKYKDYSFDYRLEADIFKELYFTSKEIKIKTLDRYKFIGGWFTLIPKKTLDKIGIPESFGHYGLEDTFISHCLYNLNSSGIPSIQYVMKNLVIGEIIKQRINNTVKSYISSISKKEEFESLANGNWVIEIERFKNELDNEIF